MQQSIDTVKLWCQQQGWLRLLQHAIVIIALFKLLPKLKIQSRGKTGILNYFIKLFLRLANKFRFYRNKVDKMLKTQSQQGVEKLLANMKVRGTYSTIPKQPLSKQEILMMLDERRKTDLDPSKGRNFALIYQVSKQHDQLTEACFSKYIHSTALNPIMFNSVRVIENEVVKMAANLFYGDDSCVGSITSCGTESLLLAMKTYREYRGNGDIIMCVSGHPGINKGCYYVGLNCIQIPYDQKTKKMSIKHLKSQISSSTVVVVCSAPQYPHGAMDDVEQIAKVCKSYGVPLHVDAAIGGFIVPWIEKLRPGKIKPWDFRVDGVCSINADVHKYGYAPKGSSVLIYKNSQIRRCQYFTFMTWPGGIYISPTALGTRNGGAFSSALGSLLALGQSGFKQTTAKILQVVDLLVETIQKNQQLQLMAVPESSIVSFTTKNFSCYKLADAMEKRGFALEKQSNPQCLHMSIMPPHHSVIKEIIKSLNESIEEIKANPDLYEGGTKAMYGMIAQIPDEAIAEDFMRYYMDQMYKFR